MGTHHFHIHSEQTGPEQIGREESQGGRGRGRGRRRRGPGGHGRGRGSGRERARRGAVAKGIMLVLAERAPLHGYELIAELEERSEGRWRPSPGSMYPALGRLEGKGMILGTVDEDGDGKKSYELTEEGRAWLAARDPDAPLPWQQEETGKGGDLRPLVAEVESAAKQVGRFGSDEQRTAATEVLTKTKADLYKILAGGESVS